MSDNAIRNFYRNISVDGMPKLDDVLNADYDWLEANHNWCQRAYPNFEKSAVVAGAPILEEDGTLEWIKTFHPDLVLKLVFKLIKHYSELSHDRIPHNNRRVTRLIKFLKLLDMNEIAETVFIVFTDSLSIHAMLDDGQLDCETAVKFWNNAVNYQKGDDWVV